MERLLLMLSIVVLVRANSTKTFCTVLKEYDQFKTTMDNYLASKEEDCDDLRADCKSILDEFPEAVDGVYKVKPTDGKGSFPVYCDMTQDSGGWLVIQQRRNESQDFYKTWFEYKDGFGNISREFWLGNEKIHRLTNQKTYELRIDLENTAGTRRYATYSYFRLGDMSSFYTLYVGQYSGDAGDQMKIHNATRFSAKNLDLDTHRDNCAQLMQGAWWYQNCAHSSLNGAYNNKYDLYWITFRDPKIKYTTMKIRPTQ